MSTFWFAGTIFTLGLLEDELKWWECMLISVAWPLYLGNWVKRKTS